MADARWQYYRFEAWAVVDGAEVPVSSLVVDYELNAIPRAVVMLPVGREVRSLAASPVHGLVGAITEMRPAQVWMNMTATAASNPGAFKGLGIPTGPFLVFDGFTSGAAYVRTRQGAQFTIGLNHWLCRLNETSCFSQSSHPSNPSAFSYGALQKSDDNGALDIVAASQAHRFVDAGKVSRDLWGESLHPWFVNLCGQDGFLAVDAGLKGGGKNDGGLDALKRMAPGGAGYRALALDLEVDEDVAGSIAEDVGITTGDPEFLAHTTLWDVIAAKFAPEYCFAVVPRVNDALVVPFVPGYRTPYASVLADEYDNLSSNVTHPRPLRAVCIQANVTSRSGGNMFDDDAAPGGGVGGLFDTAKQGTILFRDGPRWMGRLVLPPRYAAAASGGDLNAVGNAAAPGAGGGGAGGAAAKAAAGAAKRSLDKYAQAKFAEEVLRGRQVSLGGAVRFDVAPGSVVRVEAASDPFIADQDALGAPFYGCVVRYSLQLDAENRVSGSAFHLAHVRNEAENGSDETSVAKHPLYKNTFGGSGLL